MSIAHPEALKPRKTPRQARSEVTVDAIFKAAIQVLLADGGRRLTMTRVAERAGVSVGTMYQYFPHKQALLYAVVQQHLQEFVEGFEAACLKLRNESLDVAAAGVVDAFVGIKIRQPEATRALYRIAAELDTDELRIGTSRRLQNAFAALLATVPGVRFGDLAEITGIAFTLLTAMNGATRAVFELGAPAPMVEALPRQLSTLCRGYLQAAASAQPVEPAPT